MSQSYDVIIIGLGAMGSAAAYHLAKKRQRVLGLDRFTPPHAFGSSHGQTRIIREAYFEHPAYVPLVQRAYENWAELERQSGQKLFQQTGGLMIGPPEGVLVSGALRSAQTHHLTHELIASRDLHRRFPAFQPTDEMLGVWEPRAGILFPEHCIAAHLDLARRAGADLRFDEPLISWKSTGTPGGVEVVTNKNRYGAMHLLITAGAWIGKLLEDLRLPLAVARQTLLWFQPDKRPEEFSLENFPIFIFEHDDNRHFYGFPDLGEGMKVALHHEGEPADPDNLDREVRAEEIDKARALLRRFIPNANGRLLSATVCMYTNTPDFHFLIDRHPQHSQVLFASPCSGHGFKFSSAIGEVLAELIATGLASFDLGMFQLKRFVTSVD
jgi:sarcosine oxidase